MNDVFRKARLSKDKNFDGRFFFGVTTTGIFCRPSCPSPIAKEHNVRYFHSIFEALDLGFRPCFRCRPDITVDYYNGNIEGIFVVETALKMIYEGYLNHHSINDLAKDLLVSDRHLRKLFIDNLGVPPVKIAKYHKSLFAKKLLIYSNHTITDIAFASGFRSIRQFNTVFKEIFGTTPSMIRKEEANTLSSTNHDNTLLLVKYQKPFSLKQILSFMKLRAIKGVEVVTENSYMRTFRINGSRGFFTVTDNPEKSSLELRINCDDIKCYMEIYQRVRKMFDLDTDFKVINAKFSMDPILSKGMDNGHVPRLPIAFYPYEFVIRAILGQQISVKAATTLAQRIAEKAGRVCDNTFPDGLTLFFPNPSELLPLSLDGIGITTTRQKTIKTVTHAILNKVLHLTDNQPYDKFHQNFLSLKGIGDWTVNYVAMRGMGIIDSFPASDLGVIKALTKNDTVPSQKEIITIAEKWRPYRSYATLCLWNSVTTVNGK